MSDIDAIRADLEIISGLERISTKDVGISIGGKRVPLEACRERAIIRTIQAAPTLLAENDQLRRRNEALIGYVSHGELCDLNRGGEKCTCELDELLVGENDE